MDDGSDMEHLGAPLDDYLSSTFPEYPVKVLRLEKREGLMRCRMAGIREAKADVLTFLDSHIEAGHGWLEPMMHRLHQDKNVKSKKSKKVKKERLRRFHIFAGHCLSSD